MRRITAAALGAALALGAGRVAAQDESRWVRVLEDTATVVSLDTASMTSLGNEVYRVWERSTGPTADKPGVLARVDFDCRLRLTRAVAVALPGYAPVQASEEDRGWTEVLPGSRYEAELRQVCGSRGSTGAGE